MGDLSYSLNEDGRRLMGHTDDLGQLLAIVNRYRSPAAMQAALLETAGINGGANVARHRRILGYFDAWMTLALGIGFVIRVN